MIKMMRGLLIVLLSVGLFAFLPGSNAVLSHEETDTGNSQELPAESLENHEENFSEINNYDDSQRNEYQSTEPVGSTFGYIKNYSLRGAGYGSALIILLVFLSLLLRQRGTEKIKKLLFWSIVAITVFVTSLLATLTIYANVVSVTGGPVHWHADYEVWGCGKEYKLISPKSWFINRVGTLELHEHNDKRIHIEGVIGSWEEITLGNFMRVVGGSLSKTSFVFPTDEGNATFINGQKCPDGQAGFVQVFRFHVAGNQIKQEKIEDPASLIIAPYSAVPPGNCLIIEFSPKKTKTDKLCLSYKIAIDKGKLIYDPD